MTQEQLLIIRAVKTGDAVPCDMTEEEFIALSPVHAEWAAAYNALREYVDSLDKSLEERQ